MKTHRNSFNPVARRNARQCVVQALYQWQMTAHEPHEIEKQFISEHDVSKVDVSYFHTLLHDIIAHQNNLDEKMAGWLDRSLQDLDPIELAVLRLGMYELVHRLDIPYKVVINEALELTKRFGTIEGYKYVNGVLDRAAHVFRQSEKAK